MAPSDQFIPMCARLLGIADAYDAMTTHRVYRVARSREEAFAELRRCAGSQFDPLLVEHFINTISASSAPDSSEKAPDRLAHVLRLGMEAEMMASALLHRDLEATVALASHLAQVATAMGSEQLSQRCQRMVSSIESASDMQTLLTEARGVLNAVAIAPPVEK